MGRLYVVLDPAGEKDVLEAGYDHRFMMDKLAQSGAIPLNDSGEGTYVPPHSQWLMGRPWNMAPYWYRDENMANHLYPKSAWTYATGIPAASIIEWEYRRTPTEIYDWDKWLMVAPLPSDFGTQPISVNFDALSTALDSDLLSATGVPPLPAGMGVVAAHGGMPGFVTPHLQWIPQPEPDDLFVFGFGDMCLVMWNRELVLLRSPNNDQQTWEKLDDSSHSIHPLPVGRFRTFLSNLNINPLHKQLFCLPVGWNQLLFIAHQDGQPWYVTTRDEPTATMKLSGVGAQIKTGPWWFAGYPGQVLRMQIQDVAYRTLTHIPALHAGTLTPQAEMFNLGSDYAPTQAPQIYVDAMVPATGYGVIAVTPITSGVQGIGSGGETIEVQLRDETGSVWTSDGTHFRGAFKITTSPNALPIGLAENTTPQIREIQLKFAPVLEDGPSTDLILDDTMFRHDWKAEWGLHDYEAKEIRIPLTDNGAIMVQAANLDVRHHYAVQISEDTDDDNVPDTVRIAGWVVRPADTTEVRLRNNSPATPQNQMLIVAKGILRRGEEKWVYRNELTNPANAGKLLHTDAVREALIQSGFPTADASKVTISTDFGEDLDPVLPGTPAEQSGNAGMMVASPYAPDYDELKIRYARRIADEWTTWLLYEDGKGHVYYVPDWAETVIDGGAAPSVAAVFYRTRAQAVSAGRSALQHYEARSEIVGIPLKANRIKCIPCDTHEVQIMNSDRASHDDPTADNYIGRWITEVRQPKMAVNYRSTVKISNALLRRWRRLKRGRTWRCKLLPWQIGAGGIEVGSLVELDGGEQYQVVHLEVKQLGPSLYESRITGEVKPTALGG